jgi:hypothetical protein
MYTDKDKMAVVATTVTESKCRMITLVNDAISRSGCASRSSSSDMDDTQEISDNRCAASPLDAAQVFLLGRRGFQLISGRKRREAEHLP